MSHILKKTLCSGSPYTHTLNLHTNMNAHTHTGKGLHYRRIQQIESCSSVSGGKCFCFPNHPDSSIHPLFKSMEKGIGGFKCPRCCSAYDSTLFSSSIKNVWSSTSTPHVSSWHVPSVQWKSSGLKFSKSRTGSHVMYNCHHNSSHFTFPIFVHSWHFSNFHSLQSTTLHIYWPKTPTHSLNLKLKCELSIINFPRHVAC